MPEDAKSPGRRKAEELAPEGFFGKDVPYSGDGVPKDVSGGEYEALDVPEGPAMSPRTKPYVLTGGK
jgi:hypothetical protein